MSHRLPRIIAGIGFCLVVISALRWLRSRPVTELTPATAPGANAAAALPAILSVEHAAFAHGRWYLADARAHQIHVVDSTGRLSHSFGRRGSGPGEFRSPSLVAATGTRVYVAEMGRTEISVFDTLGVFLRFLRMNAGCGSGRVAAMTTARSDLYVLRRCLDPRSTIRHRVERSRDGADLAVWAPAADTFITTAGASVPLMFPILAAYDDLLVFGEGGSLCLRVFQLPAGRPETKRCLRELPRHVLPALEREQLRKRWRGRIDLPDSLPRIVTALLFDGTLAVQALETSATATWQALSWQAPSVVRPLGRPHVQNSFLGPRSQLLVWDEAEGVRLEVVPIER